MAQWLNGAVAQWIRWRGFAIRAVSIPSAEAYLLSVPYLSLQIYKKICFHLPDFHRLWVCITNQLL